MQSNCTLLMCCVCTFGVVHPAVCCVEAMLSPGLKCYSRFTHCSAVTHLSRHGVTGELEDSMESFFLSETSKYLFLLQANTTHLPDHYVFTTEGHLLPPFATARPQPPAAPAPISQHAAWTHHLHRAWSWLSPDFGIMWRQSSEGALQSDMMVPPSLTTQASTAAAEKCDSLCSDISDADIQARQRLLQASLPLLPLAAQDAVILRQAFCTGCCLL